MVGCWRFKRRYDPYFILYGPASVGSDYWAVGGLGWKAVQGSPRTERNYDGADSCSHAIALTPETVGSILMPDFWCVRAI